MEGKFGVQLEPGNVQGIWQEITYVSSSPIVPRNLHTPLPLGSLLTPWLGT
jgi:hypothetical protein